MNRAQIVIDEELLMRSQAYARHCGTSFSSLVRQALEVYLRSHEPNTSWMGSVPIDPSVTSHDWADVQRALEQGMAEHRK